MKRTAPAEYNAFLELAINLSEKLSNTEKSELINRYKTAYSEGTQTEFSDAQALDEIAADFTSRIVKDISLFDRLAQNNRNAAVRFLDSIKDFIAKVKSTFSGDKAKADTASQEKYGASISELETAVAQFEKMLTATETAVASGNINTAGTETGGEVMYSIKTNAKGKYVKADRQVIFGMDPKSWGEQVEKYIYKKIMNGETVQIPTDDGDVLSLTENTVGKSSFRNFIKKENRYMNDEEYLTKLNAETHIDELAQISRRGDKVVPDFNGIHGEMAKDGWNYRIAYFEDFDGKYYRVKISTALGEDGKTVYNIDEVRERSFPTFSGSSSENRGAHSDFVQNEKTIGVKASSKETIPQTSEKSNRQNSLKTGDLLSPEYGRMQNEEGRVQSETSPSPSTADAQGSDTSSTASGPPSPQGEGSGGEGSAISNINTAINRNQAGGGFTKTEYSNKITNKQIRALKSIGRALGVNISIGAPTGNGKGAYNGRYENGNIVIAQDAENPLEVVLCHEVTHHMKRTAPAEYNAFLELAINLSESLSNTEKSELINRYKTAYSEGTQTEFSDTQALDEIAADFTSRIVKDISLFDRLAQNNRNAAARFLDSINDFIAKVKSTFSGDKAKADTASQEKYGASISELETAVAQFEKMLTATETAVASGNINTAGTNAGGEVMYDLKGNLLSDLQDVFARKSENDRNELLIGTTSDFLVNELGAEPLQVTMPKNKAYAAMATEEEAKSAGRYNKELNYHGLGADLLYEALASSESPVVAFVDESKVNEKTGKFEDRSDRIVLVTDKKKDGNNIVVIMQVNADGRYAGKQISANKDITVFDRKSLSADISKAIADGRLLHYDKKRSQTISAGRPGANSPGTIQNVDFKNNIARFWANVNWKKSGSKSVFEAPATDNGTAFAEAYNKSIQESNRQNSLKTGDLLSPSYGKTTETQGSDTSSTASGSPSPQGEGSGGEGSYIEDTGLDTYFDRLDDKSQVTAEKNGDEKESQVMGKPEEEKKTFRKEVSESASFAKRKMLNSGDAIRKIAKTTKDKYVSQTVRTILEAEAIEIAVCALRENLNSSSFIVILHRSIKFNIFTVDISDLCAIIIYAIAGVTQW